MCLYKVFMVTISNSCRQQVSYPRWAFSPRATIVVLPDVQPWLPCCWKNGIDSEKERKCKRSVWYIFFLFESCSLSTSLHHLHICQEIGGKIVYQGSLLSMMVKIKTQWIQCAAYSFESSHFMQTCFKWKTLYGFQVPSNFYNLDVSLRW